MNYENFENIEDFNNNDIEENFKSKNPFKKAFKKVGNIVKKAEIAVLGKKNQQKLAKLQNNILGIKKKKKSTPSPPKPIVYALNQNNFNNDMYFDIFCPYSNFKNFPNTTFNKTDLIESKTVQNIAECKLNASNNITSTSYTYNKNTKNCTIYKGYPSSINKNQNSYESGIKTNLKYNYNSLNSTQKKNIQKHCINKRFQTAFGDNKLDVRDCFNQIKNNKSNDYIDLNAQCVWSKVNSLGKGKLLNKSERVNKNKIGGTISSKSMDKYQSDYTNYLVNIQNYFDMNKKLEVDDNKFNRYNIENNIKIDELKKELTSTAEGNIALSQIPKINRTTIIGSDKETFENHKDYFIKKKKEICLILILLIIIIFIIYIKIK